MIFPSRPLQLAAAFAAACLAYLPTLRAVTFTQVSATEWTASNGLIAVSMNPTNGNISKLSTTLNGVTTNWMDPASPSPFGHAIMFYDLYSYANPSGTRGPLLNGFHQSSSYVDMWVTKTHISGTDPLEVENHWIIHDGDPGIHFYQVLRHAADDAATNFGAATVNFFPSGNAITRSDGSVLLYMKNTGPNILTTVLESGPNSSYTQSLVAANPGRQVQAETVDYTATGLGTHLSAPGLTREFGTKYNTSTYAQYHVAHGFVGATNGMWWVVPSNETFMGGPTKQFLTGIQLEYQSAHLGGENIGFAAGEVSIRRYGPFYLHFNAFDSTKTTADALYNDAASRVASCLGFYDAEGILLSNGYRARVNRATVTATVSNSGGWNSNTNKNVIILSDNAKFFQESSKGYQYWGYANTSGNVTLPDVMPGKYRLTTYELGQWGTGHIDNINVGTTPITVTGAFQPRNFSAQAPIWQIGIPDRSAWEFLHGHDANGHDIRDYFGRWNYWQDLQANKGKVVYKVGTSNYQTDWPFVHYGRFYPGLAACVYNSADQSSAGYDYIAPQYVKDWATANGKAIKDYFASPWEVHFTTTAAQLGQGNYVLVSINTAGVNHSSLQVRLNGKHGGTLLWYPRLGSDPEVRSGVAGYNNFAVFQFNKADLNAAGQDNVLTLTATGAIMYDALKLEISANPADPAVTGWHDYDWMHYNAADASTNDAATDP